MRYTQQYYTSVLLVLCKNSGCSLYFIFISYVGYLHSTHAVKPSKKNPYNNIILSAPIYNNPTDTMNSI